MPNPSQHFLKLQSSITELKNIYLPNSFNSTGIYTHIEQEKVRAFVVLAHAEIEFFVEEIFREASSNLSNAFINGNITPETLSFLTFMAEDTFGCGDKITNSGNNTARTVATRMGKSLKRYHEILDGNHGLREKFLAKIFIPFSISGNKVDPVWVTEIDRLSNNRGAYAHKSRTEREASCASINPQDVWNQIEKIIFGQQTPPTQTSIYSMQSLDLWAITFNSQIQINPSRTALLKFELLGIFENAKNFFSKFRNAFSKIF